MNPFTELLAIIDDWTRTPGSTILVKRGEELVWDGMDRAIRLLLEISDFLRDRREDFPTSQQLILVLWDFLVQPDRVWGSTGHTQDSVNVGWRAMMEAMAAVWDKESAPIVVLDSAKLESLRGTLEEVRVLVGEMLELPSEERDYLLELIGKCQRFLDTESIDFPAARAACMEVVGATAVTAVQHGGEKSKTLLQKILAIGGTWFSAFSSGATANIASETALKMLTAH